MPVLAAGAFFRLRSGILGRQHSTLIMHMSRGQYVYKQLDFEDTLRPISSAGIMADVFFGIFEATVRVLCDSSPSKSSPKTTRCKQASVPKAGSSYPTAAERDLEESMRQMGEILQKLKEENLKLCTQGVHMESSESDVDFEDFEENWTDMRDTFGIVSRCQSVESFTPESLLFASYPGNSDTFK